MNKKEQRAKYRSSCQAFAQPYPQTKDKRGRKSLSYKESSNNNERTRKNFREGY